MKLLGLGSIWVFSSLKSMSHDLTLDVGTVFFFEWVLWEFLFWFTHTLGLQIFSPKKFFIPLKPSKTTFSEGSWSPRDIHGYTHDYRTKGFFCLFCGWVIEPRMALHSLRQVGSTVPTVPPWLIGSLGIMDWSFQHLLVQKEFKGLLRLQIAQWRYCNLSRGGRGTASPCTHRRCLLRQPALLALLAA